MWYQCASLQCASSVGTWIGSSVTTTTLLVITQTYRTSYKPVKLVNSHYTQYHNIEIAHHIIYLCIASMVDKICLKRYMYRCSCFCCEIRYCVLYTCVYCVFISRLNGIINFTSSVNDWDFSTWGKGSCFCSAAIIHALGCMRPSGLPGRVICFVNIGNELLHSCTFMEEFLPPLSVSILT